MTTAEKRIVTLIDYNRLMQLIEPLRVKREMPIYMEKLLAKLQGAELVDQQEVSKNIITMNSKILLKNLINGRVAEITLTYPKDSNPMNSRISVLSDIGVSLLGNKKGEIVTWQTPVGQGEFCVEEVLYQPEASKEFQL
ncbi:MAG: GreA/GreB family elongation factor [Cyclobacteriaceae bacterium]|nr:GreA/GreB family elongation factor [Cyclobacteriaceae bacterium]